MAMHFTEAAALLQLPAAKKLVLMAFADSADKDTRVAIPGFDTILQWSGLKRSQAYDAITELVDDGYLARRSAGRSGRRAEFYVFPRGACCPLHGPLPDYAEPPADGQEEARNDADSGSGEPDPGQKAAEGDADVDEPAAAAPQPSTATSGSGSGSGTGSGLDRTPSRLPGSENPPNPPGKPGGDCGCGRKRCRACGTSPRAARRAADAAAAAELEQLHRRRAAVPWCGGHRCDGPTTRRLFDGETGRPIGPCPECNPDVVVGPAPPPVRALAAAR